MPTKAAVSMAGSSLTPKDHLEANTVGVVVMIGNHLLVA